MGLGSKETRAGGKTLWFVFSKEVSNFREVKMKGIGSGVGGGRRQMQGIFPRWRACIK